MGRKEKAIELFNKFHHTDEHGFFIMERYQAKRAALIAVDELIDAFEQLSIQDSGSVFRDFGHGYWREVKQEIINING